MAHMAHLLARQAVPTQAAGAIATATNAATEAATAVATAISTINQIKTAWSSPSNCFHSNWCRIPVAIIILMGVSMIISCICCIKGCADCFACCCCRTSARSRERLRPPDPQGYAAQNYGYGQQPPTYQPYNRSTPGGGSLFPMPERPKYERLGDDDQAIKLDDMTPKHAYLDGDDVVAQPPAQKETNTPLAENAGTPPLRMPAAPYPLTDDGYHPPPPPLHPGGRPQSSSRIASPVRRDYQPSPRQQSYADPYHDEYSGYAGDHSNQSYNNAYHHSEGGYGDEQDPYYYENAGGRYGGRGDHLVV